MTAVWFLIVQIVAGPCHLERLATQYPSEEICLEHLDAMRLRQQFRPSRRGVAEPAWVVVAWCSPSPNLIPVGVE